MEDKLKTAKILDVCCGSRMFYFQRESKDVIYMDIRELETTLSDGRELKVKPDILGDFRSIPFEDNRFKMIVFDPPHLVQVGDSSWLCKKYGKLNKETWKEDIRKGFEECFRVLELGGVLNFKWNEEQVKLSEVLKLTTRQPLYGNKRAKTHWVTFIKGSE
jgi:ubiquinone/menaquinone biosynthesis C-methylase UbiE